MTDEPKSLWLPGEGFVPMHLREAMKAVEDYAGQEFGLGRDEVTGDWLVLHRHGPDGYPFPVFNLGRELPSRDEIQRKLYQGDVRRRGGEIVRQVVRANDARQKALRDQAHDAAEEAAYEISTAFHVAKRHPAPRIFVPGR